ncbi:MAG: hypothetical protein NUV78_00495 [Candidatus Zambryskibacteria bacterium]|nr:hypothetical protein [Candidatus Zambryskibacteria bacterium]
MARANIIVAVAASLILIGGAGWIRFNDTQGPTPTLSSVQTTPNYSAESEITSFESVRSESDKPLTQTDLIGRQLFSEYINLSTKGQATSENLNKLASDFANNILESHVASSIAINDIVVVPDTATSLQSYSNKIFSIRNKYESIISSAYKQSGFSSAADPKFQKFMMEVGKYYKQAADEMQTIPTPASLSNNHVLLVNNYLSSSAATFSLSNIGTDPVSAYAALNIQTKNTVEEAKLLSQINLTLIQQGLPPGNI